MEDWKKYTDMGDDKQAVVKYCMDLCPQGVFLEIGTNAGGTAMLALEHPNSTTEISIDPYGGVEFRNKEGQTGEYSFSDKLYLESLIRISSHALINNKNYVNYKTTSKTALTQDIDLWIDGRKTKLADTKFAFVLIDGDHTDDTVFFELSTLQDKMLNGGIILVDNTDWLTIDFGDGWESPRDDMKFKRF